MFPAVYSSSESEDGVLFGIKATTFCGSDAQKGKLDGEDVGTVF